MKRLETNKQFFFYFLYTNNYNYVKLLIEITNQINI